MDRLNKRYAGRRFQVFKGIESDILADGALDYSDEVLKTFDLVIASLHSRFRMSRAEQTSDHQSHRKSLHYHFRSCDRPVVDATARFYEVDMERILKACETHGVAIEINANPWWLDMDWRWCARGLELGCMFSINPDSHSTEEIDNVHWGVLIARQGAVLPDRVLKALNLVDFHAYLRARKENKIRR